MVYLICPYFRAFHVQLVIECSVVQVLKYSIIRDIDKIQQPSIFASFVLQDVLALLYART